LQPSSESFFSPGLSIPPFQFCANSRLEHLSSSDLLSRRVVKWMPDGLSSLQTTEPFLVFASAPSLALSGFRLESFCPLPGYATKFFFKCDAGSPLLFTKTIPVTTPYHFVRLFDGASGDWD